MKIASQSLARAPNGPLAAMVADEPPGNLEPAFVGLAQLAAGICQAPLASISIMGSDESWCSANSIVPATALPRQNPFVEHVTGAPGLFEVPDTALDGRFRDSEFVLGFPAVRSYVGCALRTTGGDLLGVLAVYGTVAREISSEQRASLRLLADQAVTQAELRARLAEIALLNQSSHVNQSARTETSAPVAPVLATALIESAPVAVYHTDAAGKITYINPEYRRIFGLTPEQGADDWAQCVHPDDLAQMERAWANFVSRPRPIRFDTYRTKPTSGSVRHLAEQIVAGEGVDGFVGTISDFTDLVTTRGNLRKAEALYSNTFDQAPIGIAYADRSGKFLSFNHSFCSMLGYNPADLTNKTIGDLTHSDDILRTASDTARLWNGGIEFVDLERRYLRKDGSALWVHMTTALVREENAAPEYSVQFLRDITARKESAEELARVNKQLMAASRQAGMAEVATNVLHNVGNILNSVNISASLVAERVKQSKAPGISRVAALLQQQGDRVGDFIANDERGRRIPDYLAGLGEQLQSDQKMALVELASLRDNLEHIKDTVAMQQSYAKLCGVTETVEVADLVEDSLRLNAGAFVRHGVTLQREFNKVPQITVDKHKVLQILVNLVRNAKYACDESGRTDKLLTLRVEPAASGVRISVIDNGVGIPEENMGRLFSHGFTTRQSGHGFGLHSGALAAQELGGTLRAESDGPGKGAAFILELPCDQTEQARG